MASARVSVDDKTTTPDQLESVEQVLRSFGIEPQVEADYVRKSLGELPFIVYVLMPIVGGFLAALGSDIYQATKRLLSDLQAAHDGRRGELVVDDREAGTRIVLGTELPDDALQALAALDWDQLEGGHLVWDAQDQRWRSSS
jgi:hypothetical protein